MIKYLSFLLKSTNEHGIHSPFVFDLVTKCFYDKKNYVQYNNIKDFQTKKINFNDKKLLFRLINYLSIQNFIIFEDTKEIYSLCKDFFSLKNVENKTDLIIITDAEYCPRIEEIYQSMNNDSLLLFLKPYACKKNEILWKEIVTNEHFIVTIDIYHFGLAFVRREQRKQHFFVRC